MEQTVASYYKVTAKCGHVGKRSFIPVTFAVRAESGKAAAAIVRCYPRVKHDHKDAILECKSISFAEYAEILENNNRDSFLKCKSRKEQKEKCDLTGRLVDDPHSVVAKHDRQARLDRIKFKKEKQYDQYEEMDWREYDA